MRVRWVIALLVIMASFTAAPVAGESKPAKKKDNEPTLFRQGSESEREARVRKAREEIRANPAQKKFILFRYGLKEEDL